MSSPDLVLELNQVVPANGGVLVPLRHWPEGLATYKRQREKFGSVTFGELTRSGVCTTSTSRATEKRGCDVIMNYNATALARALGRSSDDIKIIELGAQLFPQSRTDLARQQARMADIIATSRSPDEVSDAILVKPQHPEKPPLWISDIGHKLISAELSVLLPPSPEAKAEAASQPPPQRPEPVDLVKRQAVLKSGHGLFLGASAPCTG